MLIEAFVTEEDDWNLVEIPTLKIVTGCQKDEDISEYIIDAVQLVLETESVELAWPERLMDRVYVKIEDDIAAAKFILKQNGITEL